MTNEERVQMYQAMSMDELHRARRKAYHLSWAANLKSVREANKVYITMIDREIESR